MESNYINTLDDFLEFHGENDLSNIRENLRDNLKFDIDIDFVSGETEELPTTEYWSAELSRSVLGRAQVLAVRQKGCKPVCLADAPLTVRQFLMASHDPGNPNLTDLTNTQLELLSQGEGITEITRLGTTTKIRFNLTTIKQGKQIPPSLVLKALCNGDLIGPHTVSFPFKIQDFFAATLSIENAYRNKLAGEKAAFKKQSKVTH